MTFPFYKQPDLKDCGPTCLKIISSYYGKIFDISLLRELCETHKFGTSIEKLAVASEYLGYRSLGVSICIDDLLDAPLPCILFWNNNHFVVLYKIKSERFYISDPDKGLLDFSKDEFLNFWVEHEIKKKSNKGVALLLEPTPKFHKNSSNNDSKRIIGFSFILRYVFQFKPYITQLILGLILGSFLQLIFPFLTQSLVDVGIKNQNIHFIYLILFSQLSLFIGKTVVDVIRVWILLHLSTRINISLISDFFIKLMNLPISFFDTRLTGDIIHRINDHKRIEKILTSSSFSVLFSIFNVITFGSVLAFYNALIFWIFFFGSLLYFTWISIFLKKRAKLDYKRFSQVSQEQSKLIELINGMQEIKLHNAEQQKRWSWEYVQARIYNVAMSSLRLEQYQTVGSGFINEFKNILITIISAKLVVEGEITLGMMLAISYVVGQLNGPISQIIDFIKELQDAKISLDRISEIHKKEDEESIDQDKIKNISIYEDIILQNVFYRYIGSDQMVLQDLNIEIPSQKVTAIVGVSGSGKTTLMKLLLKFYDPKEGHINLGRYNLKNISQKTWRNHCGVVMQEGYIFNDSIANNIAITHEGLDKEKLIHAVEVANLREFIETLPLAYNTKIGMEGVGLSTGQKQRILIARAVYKNPDFLFFDEATSALDANTEKTIMEQLKIFFKNKTVLIIAHRLSTVKNADQIVVLDKGKIIEKGNHTELVNQKGAYYHLVKNQLELGN